jgi:hypothetical protein
MVFNPACYALMTSKNIKNVKLVRPLGDAKSLTGSSVPHIRLRYFQLGREGGGEGGNLKGPLLFGERVGAKGDPSNCLTSQTGLAGNSFLSNWAFLGPIFGYFQLGRGWGGDLKGPLLFGERVGAKGDP